MDLPDYATRRFAGLSICPACHRTEVLSQSRPMFHGPSWGNHSCVPLCSMKFRGTPMNRVAREAITSSGASSRLAPKRTRKFPPLPAGGDRTFGHLPRPRCRCRLLGRPGPPSRSPMHHAPAGRVGEAKNAVRSLWIMGISGTTVGTLSQSRFRPPTRPDRLPFRSPQPTSRRA